jgi:hypothetical protein
MQEKQLFSPAVRRWLLACAAALEAAWIVFLAVLALR